MSRGSFGRTVARAAASGGSRTYRGRSPRAFYALLFLICAAGVFLIVYSRNERLHPKANPAAAPTASDHWYAALGFDLCGKVQANLPKSPNFTTVGLRTLGDGVVLISPGIAANPSAFEGKNDTLGTFAANYPGFTLTASSLQLPALHQPLLKNGQSCTKAVGPLRGKSQLVVWTWPSPHAKGARYTGDLTKLHLDNGMMVMVGFVPPGTTLPVPPSRAALVADLNGQAIPPASTLPPLPTTTVPSTTLPSTTVPATTLPKSSTTTSTTAGRSHPGIGTVPGSGAATTAPAGASSSVASSSVASSSGSTSSGPKTG